MEENAPSFITIIVNLMQAYLKRLMDLAELASLEARLALRTFITISFLFVVLLFLLPLSWICALGVLFFYLTSLQFSALFAAMTVAGINIFLVTAILIYIVRIKENLFFPATRKQISHIEQFQEIPHEQTTPAD